jgi:class 3 adenylate cyclase
MQPETRYARNGDVSIAYQAVGDGPLDIVFVPGLISHLEAGWANAEWAKFLNRLASFSRLILLDKRGGGLSDPAPGVPLLEDDIDDVLAVMDAAGSERPALLGVSEGGPMSTLFAASYPERTRALILLSTFPKGTEPGAWDLEPKFAGVIDATEGRWGEGRTLDIFAPSLSGSELWRRVWGGFERAAGSPALVRARIQACRQLDVTPVLSSIHVPTLVVHRVDEGVPVAAARFMAEHIPGAQLVELPGQDHAPFVGNIDEILDPIEEFLTGARPHHAPDRVLATVLFTDIVGSTERAAELGDRRWREVSDQHDAIVREELERARGREVKTMGDGFLATFDGPARAIECAAEIRDRVAELGIQIRAGLHTGECELAGDDVRGMAVNIGARVGALAAPGEVLVSSTVKDLVVGSGIHFTDRRTHELKGVPGEWRVFAVGEDRREPEPLPDERTRDPEAYRHLPAGDRAVLRTFDVTSRRAPGVARGLSRVFLRTGRRRADR